MVPEKKQQYNHAYTSITASDRPRKFSTKYRRTGRIKKTGDQVHAHDERRRYRGHYAT